MYASTVEVLVTIDRILERTYRVNSNIFLPQSQVEEPASSLEEGEEAVLTIPKWLATETGLA